MNQLVTENVNAIKMIEIDIQKLLRKAKVALVGPFWGEVRLSLLPIPTRAYKLIVSYIGKESNELDEAEIIGVDGKNYSE